MEQHALGWGMLDELAYSKDCPRQVADLGANARADSKDVYMMTVEAKSNCRCSKTVVVAHLDRRRLHGSWESSLGLARCARTSLRPVAPWSCRLWGRRSLSWPKSCRERDEVLPHLPVARKGNIELEGSEARQDCPDDGLVLRP